MGTNYYLKPKFELKDDLKSLFYWSGVHIGKSSIGHGFHVHVYLEEGFTKLEDFLKVVEENSNIGLYDEYGREQNLDEFKEFIENKRTHSGPDTYSDSDFI